MYRLTNEVSICCTNSGTYTNAYQYDKCGNRFAKIHYRNGVTTITTNVFNANDQLLTEVSITNSVPCETNSYAYDSNGSLIAMTNVSSGSATVLYGYDLKNKLSSVTTVGSSVINLFTYNHEGIRVRSSGATTTHYLIDANNHTGYQQILEELSTPGATASRSYLIGDDVLAQYDSNPNATKFLLYDGHGSTRQLADGSGGVGGRYNYDAYGETLTGSTSPAQTSLLFCGEQFDSGLEMYNLRARYYNPANGRFTQLDTFEGVNDDPHSLHKYTYANSDPVMGIDPTGQFTMVELLVATGILGLLAAMLLPAIGKTKQKAKNKRLRALNIDPFQDQIDSGQINLHEFLLMPADQQEEQLKWIYDNGVRQQQITLAKEGDTIWACNTAEGLIYANDFVGITLGFGGVGTFADIDILGQGSEDAVQVNEITTYASFKDRSIIGDNLQGHELWMFANQKAHGAATARLGNAASRNNPVIALDNATHAQISAAQAALDPASMTPLENIDACAAIMRRLNSASPEKIDALQKLAIQHAKSLGY
jgi:RHS repeat-associated protein